MDVQFISSVSVITADPVSSRALYVEALGLPLKPLDTDYHASEEIAGTRHFGVWPLEQVALACFGSTSCPEHLPVPQVSLEFELAHVEAVAAAAAELEAAGYPMLHQARTEPWGQTVARLLSPEGSVVGLSYAPWMHESDESAAGAESTGA